MKNSPIFTTIRIGQKTAPNRIVYQATETNNCDQQGRPTELTFEVYRDRAKGHPGIIFIESIDVSFDCQARSNRMVLTPENKDSYKELINAIKEISPETLVMFQISHAGRLSDPRFRPPLYPYSRSSGEDTMTTDEVKKAIRDFCSASLLVDEIGGDGVDIKQAHGFLAGDFLHPGNNRPDEYGGSFENRTRFFSEIFKQVKKNCSKDFIIGTRISPYEGIPGGCGTASRENVLEDLSEIRLWVRQLESMGVDFINVSAGYANANLEILTPTAIFPEGVYRHFSWTREIKKEVSIPVIGSGYTHPANGANNLIANSAAEKSLVHFAEMNLKNNAVDLIGVGRQVFADPLFAAKLRDGAEADINWCTTCSGCGVLLGNNKNVGCSKYYHKYATLFAEC